MDTATYLNDVHARQQRAWPGGVPRELHYPLGEAPVTDYLRHWAAATPDQAAIIYYGTRISYAELDEASDRFAGWLEGAGVRAGDRVGVLLPNCPQFVIAMMGVLKLGAVHVPVNPMFQHHELRHELADAGVEVLVAASGLRPLIGRVRADTALRRVLTTSPAALLPEHPALPLPPALRGDPEDDEWDQVTASPRAGRRAVDMDALAALNYTGGTTGLPKGCEHTQRHMLYTAVTADAARGPRQAGEATVSLVYIPVFWIAGENTGILIPIVRGSAVVLLARWDPLAVLQAVARYRVTELVGTVDNYVELMDHPDFARHDLSSVTNPRAMSFVRKLTPEIRRRWADSVGHHSVIREGAYGMTETHTSDTITYGFDDGDRDLRSEPVFCGVPCPGTAYMVVDPATREPLPLGEQGALLIRTPSMMTGYWNRPDATSEALRDGWLHTGDVGMIDADGCLHYLGRDKDMIKVSGMSVFPSEVEALLALHPQVTASAVVPMPDDKRGQIPLAFVQQAPGAALTAESLTAWARENMAAYKLPRVEFVTSLPMTATGKIRRGELAERAHKLAQEL